MEDEPAPPTPDNWKAAGTEAFQNGEYEDALQKWRKALSLVLKASVRAPTKENYDASVALRLNIALTLLKQNNYLEAIDNLSVVNDQHPDNLKCVYRLAQAYRGLQEWSKCHEHLDHLLALEPDNRDGLLLRENVKREEALAKKKESDQMKKMFRGALKSSEVAETALSDVRSVAPVKLPNERLLKMPKILWMGVDADTPTSPHWSKGHTGQDLKDDNLPLVLSLPMTILDTLDSVMNRAYKIPPKLTPKLENHQRRMEEMVAGEDSNFIAGVLGREKLTIHALGARGDAEMLCSWASLLQRLPRSVKTLQVVTIGFVDPTDSWCVALQPRVLSPPLVKRITELDADDGPTSSSVDPASAENSKDGQERKETDVIKEEDRRRVQCRMFKGLYQHFLKDYHDVLTRPTHDLFPNIILIAEPNFSRYLDAWAPALAAIMDAQPDSLIATCPLIIATGYSATEVASHEALNLAPVLRQFGARQILPMRWNPFAIRVVPDEDLPPMVVSKEGSSCEYRGASSKNAVSTAFRGATALYKPKSLELKAIRKALAEMGVDAESEAEEMRKFVEEHPTARNVADVLEA